MSMDLTNSERIADPEQGLTQGALATYYAAVAPSILPHVADRPLAVVRRDGIVPHETIRDERGLAGLVEEFALEIHAAATRASDLEHPDRLVYELDPGDNATFAEVAQAAQVVRALFLGLELEAFVMTRGRRGLDVVVPIEPELDWGTVRQFGATIAETLVTAAPTRYSAQIDANARNTVRIGYLAEPRSTSVAPYSTQLLANAPVAMPAFWYELEALDPDAWTPAKVAERVRTLPSDPWEGVTTLTQRLTPERRSSLANALERALGA